MAANGGANTHHPAQRPRDKAQLTPKPTLVPPPATPQTARKGRLNFLYSRSLHLSWLLLAALLLAAAIAALLLLGGD